ncbi:MAG: prepilin-type N-terminal cleavage/methylation domain-containing protein [Pirellulaceae bacterium]
MKPRHNSRDAKAGISLLEVILAIAILGMSMVAITNLLNIGYRAAGSSRLRTEAAIFCDSTMAEVAAGVIELTSASDQPVSGTNDWLFSVNVQSADITGLLSVTVTVKQADSALNTPLSVSLVRFMPDPDYDPAEESQ